MNHIWKFVRDVRQYAQLELSRHVERVGGYVLRLAFCSSRSGNGCVMDHPRIQNTTAHGAEIFWLSDMEDVENMG
ncbi:unnamed protein product [Caenorhabditis brenneri]